MSEVLRNFFLMATMIFCQQSLAASNQGCDPKSSGLIPALTRIFTEKPTAILKRELVGPDYHGLRKGYRDVGASLSGKHRVTFISKYKEPEISGLLISASQETNPVVLTDDGYLVTLSAKALDRTAELTRRLPKGLREFVDGSLFHIRFRFLRDATDASKEHVAKLTGMTLEGKIQLAINGSSEAIEIDPFEILSTKPVPKKSTRTQKVAKFLHLSASKEAESPVETLVEVRDSPFTHKINELHEALKAFGEESQKAYFGNAVHYSDLLGILEKWLIEIKRGNSNQPIEVQLEFAHVNQHRKLPGRFDAWIDPIEALSLMRPKDPTVIKAVLENPNLDGLDLFRVLSKVVYWDDASLDMLMQNSKKGIENLDEVLRYLSHADVGDARGRINPAMNTYAVQRGVESFALLAKLVESSGGKTGYISKEIIKYVAENEEKFVQVCRAAASPASMHWPTCLRIFEVTTPNPKVRKILEGYANENDIRERTRKEKSQTILREKYGLRELN